MANLSSLTTVISAMFDVLGAIITGIVDLLTGDLLVLAIVGAFIGLIVGLITWLFSYVRNVTQSSVRTRR